MLGGGSISREDSRKDLEKRVFNTDPIEEVRDSLKELGFRFESIMTYKKRVRCAKTGVPYKIVWNEYIFQKKEDESKPIIRLRLRPISLDPPEYKLTVFSVPAEERFGLEIEEPVHHLDLYDLIKEHLALINDQPKYAH